MKVTALALIPPPAAKDCPTVTPELLASSLAKYSRSNKGIQHILSTINWADPDKAVDAIFKFVDYGHASIGGLTGGIPIAIDGCSLLLAYKIFELAQLSDGQESSTRYIEIDPVGLPDPADIGIPVSLRSEWSELMAEAFEQYHGIYRRLDDEAQKNPAIVRIPKGANEKTADRMRKNYALDRARYLIPFATKNNAAYVMTARVWAQTIRQLDSLEWPEARQCASMLREELGKFTPRLIRHSHRDAPSVAQALQETEFCRAEIAARGVPETQLADRVSVTLDGELSPLVPAIQSVQAAFTEKVNRYSVVGDRVRRTIARFGWNNVAIAELRDLNRHRSGYRFTALNPVGFYLPPEADSPAARGLVRRLGDLTVKCAAQSTEGAHLYCYLFGTQVPFEHSTHLDKLIYEIELRTGLGAHFRYADHLAAVAREVVKVAPELTEFIEVGTAEPE